MINKLHRFHGLGSLRFVYKGGKTDRGSWSTTKVILNPKNKTYRVSVVVSKKVSKSAVVRNRIRRRVYEAIRHCQPKINQPYDIVITVFSDKVAEMPFAEVQNEVKKSLERTGVISAN